jgi:hypothetical protein
MLKINAFKPVLNAVYFFSGPPHEYKRRVRVTMSIVTVPWLRVSYVAVTAPPG